MDYRTTSLLDTAAINCSLVSYLNFYGSIIVVVRRYDTWLIPNIKPHCTTLCPLNTDVRRFTQQVLACVRHRAQAAKMSPDVRTRHGFSALVCASYIDWPLHILVSLISQMLSYASLGSFCCSLSICLLVFVFSARQHIMNAIARCHGPSIGLSVRHTGGSVKDDWS